MSMPAPLAKRDSRLASIRTSSPWCSSFRRPANRGPAVMTRSLQSTVRIALSALAAILASGDWGLSTAKAETSAQFEVSATVAAGCLVDGLGTSGHAGTIGTLDFGTDSTFSTATHTATTTAAQAIRLR